MADVLYTLCDISYYAGVQTLRLLHRMRRFFSLVFAPIWVLVRRLLQVIRRHRGRTLRAKFKTLIGHFREAGRRVATAWKEHPLQGLKQIALLPLPAFRRYHKHVKRLAVAAAIVCALWVLQFTLSYWGNISFALALTDAEGETWGYVSDESELQAGIAMARERMQTTGVVLNTDDKVDVSLHMIPFANILNREEICDRLLERLDVPLKSACGVYVDNRFRGAVVGRGNTQRLLNEILEEKEEGQAGVTASFFETVDLVEGQYPPSRVMSASAMKESLIKEGAPDEFYQTVAEESWATIAENTGVDEVVLRELNPEIEGPVAAGKTILIRRGVTRLRVLVSGTMEYNVEQPFAVKRVPDNAAYEGHERVQVNGAKGVSRVTATVTYLDGEQLSSVITSSVVIKEPVTQVVAYGTRKIDKDYQGGEGSTGRFVWPTPSTHYVSQHYSAKHGALDIWGHNMEGDDILAADGGTVRIATDPTGTSWWSYGKYIVIDHGNGYQTLYAHCSKLLVKPGDKVLQGQRIALVGNTGRSTSPHLHFEVRINGRKTDPMKFF